MSGEGVAIASMGWGSTGESERENGGETRDWWVVWGEDDVRDGVDCHVWF